MDSNFFDDFFSKWAQDAPQGTQQQPEWAVWAQLSMQWGAISERCRQMVERGNG